MREVTRGRESESRRGVRARPSPVFRPSLWRQRLPLWVRDVYERGWARDHPRPRRLRRRAALRAPPQRTRPRRVPRPLARGRAGPAGGALHRHAVASAMRFLPLLALALLCLCATAPEAQVTWERIGFDTLMAGLATIHGDAADGSQDTLFATERVTRDYGVYRLRARRDVDEDARPSGRRVRVPRRRHAAQRHR